LAEALDVDAGRTWRSIKRWRRVVAGSRWCQGYAGLEEAPMALYGGDG
jgi:hypothetical protein